MTTTERPGRYGLALWVGALALAVLDASPVTAGEEAKTDPPKYVLRYKFVAGQTLRWEVLHRSSVQTSVSGTDQVAETVTKSIKVWKVTRVAPDGTATFEHSVEDVDMRHKLTGRDEVRYNSRTDPAPPLGFQDVAEAVGKRLATVTIDAQGNIQHRRNANLKGASKIESQITVPLPAGPVPVGYTWSTPGETTVTLPKGPLQKVKTLQQFTLREVKTGVATIAISTQILTPIHDPAIEAQLVQWAGVGTLKFDIDAGRVIQQQTDVDRRVVGFRAPASAIQYLSRYEERFLPETPRTARRPATP